MSDATRRGIRTALQLLYTLATSGGILGLLKVFHVNLTVEQYAAVTAVLLPVMTAAVNALEDHAVIPAVLKAPASDGADPVPNDAGFTLLDVVLVLLGIALVIWILAAIR